MNERYRSFCLPIEWFAKCIVAVSVAMHTVDGGCIVEKEQESLYHGQTGSDE